MIMSYDERNEADNANGNVVSNSKENDNDSDNVVCTGDGRGQW